MAIQPDYVVLNFLVKSLSNSCRKRFLPHDMQNTGIFFTFMEGPYLELVDLEHLHSAMLNPHIAHALREDTAAMNILHSTIQRSHLPASTREVAERNIRLANGWVIAETLMSGSDSINEGSAFEQETFITWLLEFITRPNAFVPFLLNVLPLVSESKNNSRIQQIVTGGVFSQEQCITLLRACQGISSVVIVMCWALLDDNFAFAHRSLAILDMLRAHDYAEVRPSVIRARTKLKHEPRSLVSCYATRS